LTYWEWQVIVALCKCVSFLALNNVNVQKELKIIHEAIERDKKDRRNAPGDVKETVAKQK